MLLLSAMLGTRSYPKHPVLPPLSSHLTCIIAKFPGSRDLATADPKFAAQKRAATAA